jgi:spoIIIJ-associated protein
MPDYVEKDGPSVEEAVISACLALGIPEEEAQIQVLAVAKSGRARVRVGKAGIVMPPPDAAVEEAPPLDLENPVYVKPPARPPRRERQTRYATDEELEELKAKVEKLLELMKTPSKVDLVEREGNRYLNITGEYEGLLIGKKGATLQALHVLVSSFLHRLAKSEDVYCNVDVAGYRAKQEDKLKQDAVALADQAIAEDRQTSSTLLNAMDRRIMHLVIKERTDVETFSVGDGEFKRVVIQKKSE